MVLTHRIVGLALAGTFLALFIWGLIAWLRNRHPGQAFWRVLAGAQAGIGVLAMTGVMSFALGGRRPLLHYAYGAFPVVVLVFAHRFARKLEGLEWAAFALAGLFNFGLLARGFMTGL